MAASVIIAGALIAASIAWTAGEHLVQTSSGFVVYSQLKRRIIACQIVTSPEEWKRRITDKMYPFEPGPVITLDDLLKKPTEVKPAVPPVPKMSREDAMAEVGAFIRCVREAS